ncbi:trehalose-phosphatase [Luteipulveratus flavus]|uniref:Trehalose 6-phosphate phosphatase n=1 Tax=Luteipulveratus flavus TaxID=3031728 RepID=A0ABT6CBS7_9MICO|nr:trehalose-phosphatase [Luteipulveratus sp. YIM 133296]MDF8266363.1 trehalose-phosphatase [Luteipulveratus sp. YIM 133296]
MTDVPAPLLSALDTYAARARVLTATDFDGVLAPLVDRPTDSRPLPGSIDVLTALSGLPGTTTAVVSGRDLQSLRLVSGLGTDSSVVLIGSHGAEASQDLGLGTTMDAAARARLGAATTYVEDIVAGHPDTRIERKPAGVVLHTRRVDEAQAASATAAALRIPDADPGIHAMRGKDVVELSVLTVTKGLALQALAESSASESVLYLGDDVTDEKAFAVLQQDHHVTVKVGDGPTCARYRVPAPDAAVAVLRAVLDRRRG